MEAVHWHPPLWLVSENNGTTSTTHRWWWFSPSAALSVTGCVGVLPATNWIPARRRHPSPCPSPSARPPWPALLPPRSLEHRDEFKNHYFGPKRVIMVRPQAANRPVMFSNWNFFIDSLWQGAKVKKHQPRLGGPLAKPDEEFLSKSVTLI